MRPVLNRIVALTLLTGGLLSSGCCGPMLANCRSGCGEVYIDPWINEPPMHEPCDSCGNYNGQSCGSCRPMFAGILTIWGYQYDGGCGSCGGCDSCGGGCDSCGGHEPGCGLEPACGLAPSCGHEPACGVDAGCGLEPAYGFEADCGVEPSCGFETGLGSCDGCQSCSGGRREFVDAGIPYGSSIVETDPIESARVVMPSPHRASQQAPIAQRIPLTRAPRSVRH